MSFEHLHASRTRIARVAALTVALAGTLAAARLVSAGHDEVDLVSDSRGTTPHTDAALVNAWGIALSHDVAWVADAGSGEVSSISPDGSVSRFHIHVPASAGSSEDAAPTGIVLNASTAGFWMSEAGMIAPAYVLVATENGTIAGWNPAFQTPKAFTVVDRSDEGASYKGLAIATVDNMPHLYATNFHKGRVDEFDNAFQFVDRPGAFTDPTLPEQYVPFGIQAVGQTIFVTYAFKTNPDDDDETAGRGLGLVSEFKPDGTFLRRFASNGDLDAPWGMALAPAKFGVDHPALVVGNFGDGRLSLFDLETGAALGQVLDASSAPMEIEGLWGVAFPPDLVHSRPRLYFAAGPGDEAHGLFGYVQHATR